MIKCAALPQILEMEEERKDWCDKLRIVRKIGNGCQGEVYQVQDIQTKQLYAMKVIKTKKQIQSKEKQRIQFEIHSNLYLSTTLSSCYFPKFYNYWLGTQTINILFELCEENAEIGFKKLSTYSQRYNYLMVLLYDGLKALSTLQKLNIIHRDIKPENILRKLDGFKMSDFGLSRVYAKGSTQTNDVGNKLGRSPQFSTGLYTTKCDIWSLGVHIFYLLQNTLPFDQKSLMLIRNNPNEIDKIISSEELEIDLQPAGRKSKNLLSFLHLILAEMIVVNPDHRSSASQLLMQHFPQNLVADRSNIVRCCLFEYFAHKDSIGSYYLIILCAYIDYYRLDGKIKEDLQSNKRKICLKVKKTILQLLKIITNNMKMTIPQLNSLSNGLICLWQGELTDEFECERIEQLNNIQSALQIYKISKVQQKFPLVQWMIRLCKVNQLINQGIKCKRIALWDLPIDFYKLL